MQQTILLADDDPAVRRMICRVLSEENYAVLTAGDGEEALKTCHKAKIDLILLDLNLPVKSGWETFEQFSTAYPLVPVIIITAQPNQVFPALACGVGALMEKPLDLPKLLGLIGELLAEPMDARIARMKGRPAAFHYLPQSSKSQSAPSRLLPNGGFPRARHAFGT